MTTALSRLAPLAALLAAGEISPALPLPPRQPLALRIALDRDTYLPWEPVLLEWTLSNETGRAVHALNVVEPAHLRFSVTAGHTDWDLYTPVIVCFRPTSRRLGPGESLTGWLSLREEFVGLPERGRVRLRATCRTAYDVDRPAGARGLTVPSNPVEFTLADAGGSDAVAVGLIERALATRLSSALPWELPTREGARRGRRVHDGDREHTLGRWYLLAPELCEELRGQSGSARFRAAASFYSGLRLQSRAYEGGAVNRDCLDAAARCFRAVVGSEGSSWYLEGLAAYHLLLCELEERGRRVDGEVRAMALAVRVRYPGTFMAREAGQVLAGASE